MNLFYHTLKTLSSFSRGERLGIGVLLILSAAIILVPVLTPAPSAPDYAELRNYMRKIDSLALLSVPTDLAVERTNYSPASASQRTFSTMEKAGLPLFPFDPNTADSLTFQRLGFSPRQAEVIIRYRASGAKFRTPDDFAKVYVVDESMFARLKPYITISHNDEATPVFVASGENFPAEIMVELNMADTTELKTVRGIGSYFAKAIVELRTHLGGFTQVDQLLEIRGMDEERLQPLRSRLTIDTDLVRKINLQTADEQILRSHPYIGAYTARGILLYRRNNPHCTLDDLLVNNILQKAQAEKLVGYIE